MGGKKRALQLLQSQACSVSRALWPPEVRRCVSTGKAAQSRRLLIMNGIYLANIKIKKQRHCAHCNRVVEYVSYVKMVQQAYPACYSPYRQLFYLSLASVLFGVGISLAVVMVRHWSLVLLLAVVWLATVYITSRLLASDMRLLRRMFGVVRHLFRSLGLWSTVQIRNITSFVQHCVTVRRSSHGPSRLTRHVGQVLPVVPRSLLPIRFPETPMPATPLIRVLETIDLSSSSIEHFLEEETSGEMPVVHECQQEVEYPFHE